MRSAIFETTIEQIAEMGVQNTRHFKFVFKPTDAFDFEEGQFVNILFDTQDPAKPVIKRSYSIASSPDWKGYFELCVRKVEGGFATGKMWEFKVGDKIKIQGPLGRFIPKRPLPKEIAFVSTGTGIAPFRAMIHALLKEGVSSKLWNILGSRYETDVLYQEEFEKLEREYPANLKNIFIVSRPKTWKGESGYVQTMLKKYITQPKDTHVYICGLTAMITEVQKTALEMGFTKEQIFFEKYD